MEDNLKKQLVEDLKRKLSIEFRRINLGDSLDKNQIQIDMHNNFDWDFERIDSVDKGITEFNQKHGTSVKVKSFTDRELEWDNDRWWSASLILSV
jgi:hypothetical protein